MLKSFRKKILLVALLNCINFLLFSQSQDIDSLKNLLNTASLDTNRVQCLYRLCFLLRDDYPAEAVKYGNAALDLATELNYKKGIASSFNNLGSVYDKIGKTKEAIDYFFKAYEIKKEINDIKGLSSTLNNLGVIYKRDREFAKSLEFYQLSLKYAVNSTNKDVYRAIMINLGILHSELNSKDSAIAYFKRARILSEKKPKLLVEVYSLLSGIYSESKQPKLTFSYADSAMNIGTQAEDTRPLSFIPLNKAKAFETLGITDSAEKYYNDYRISLKDSSQHERLQYLYNRLSNFNYRQFKMTNRVAYLENAYIYDTLFLYERSKVFTFEKSKLISNIYRQIEVGKLESEIQKTKKEKEITELKSAKQQFIIYAGLIVMLIVVIFSYLLYKRFTLTNRQKQIIEEKNKSITESIQYAKRIQTSLLPTEKYIERVINKKN